MTHARSDELLARATELTPGGVHSNVRLTGARRFFARGEGAWLWDVDGNDYVDYLLGQGPSFLGHAPAAVMDAVADACRRGLVFAAQHELEVEAAELFLGSLGWADRVRFGLTGTEMVQAALRLARAATGRTRFVRFEGHYHGWLDNVLVAVAEDGARPASAGQPPEALADAIVLPWNDLGAVEQALARHGDDTAAVRMEPMMCNAGAIPPRPGYLEGVREACDRHGTVLVFDEVITGFRVAPGGAAARFGVVPDLAVYGKALAGGWPVAALAGRRELMEPFGSGRVNHSGTLNANVMAMAAVTASLGVLCDDPPYERVERVGRRVLEGVAPLGRAAGLRVQGLPMAFHASFGDAAEVTDYRSLQSRDAARYRKLADLLVGDLAEIFVPRADGNERLRHPET
jgi:glutamate-1-semialdehyde 2,1-aminomutase